MPLLNYILATDPVTIVMRGSAGKWAHNAFEMALHIMCVMLDVRLEVHKPEAGGRKATFIRDIEMVESADVVLCVFSSEHPMEGGTAHVVEKAMDAGVPVYSYTCEPDSHVWKRLGEHDPEDSWKTRVPCG
jgi:hypothetical protein